MLRKLSTLFSHKERKLGTWGSKQRKEEKKKLAFSGALEDLQCTRTGGKNMHRERSLMDIKHGVPEAA